MKSLWIGLCGALASFCLVLGVFVGNPTVSVSAASVKPQITMLAGASARKTIGEPGIKFTAEIENYEQISGYNYGMLILPEEAWDNLGWDANTQYHAYFASHDIQSDAIADIPCTPYRMGDSYYISGSLTNILPTNYDMSFVGVAYSVDKATNEYTYTAVDLVENGRSIAYVAQMALKYEDELTADQKSSLNAFVNGSNIEIDKEIYWDSIIDSVGGGVEGASDNYAMQYNFNVTDDPVTQITKQAYAGGSTVSFKYYIPAGTKAGWWGIAWHTNAANANNYHAAGIENAIGYQALGTQTGAWVSVSFTLPASGSYYLYFGAEMGEGKGNWMVNGQKSYALIDDFTIGSVTEDFNKGVADSIFAVKVPAGVSECLLEKGKVELGNAAYQVAGQLVVDKLNSLENSLATVVTKESYAVGTTVSFKYYVPSDVPVGGWAKLCAVADVNKSSIYANWIADIPLGEKDSWQTVTVTMSKAGYLYFAADVGQWGNYGENGWGYILIDDFSINGTVVANFEKGVAKSIFNVNIEGAFVDSASGEGYVDVQAPSEPEEPSVPEQTAELAMKYLPNEDGLAAVTTKAYAGGSAVTFKYYIKATQTQWWGIAWHTDAASADNYHAAGIHDVMGYKSLGSTTGAWTTFSFTLPDGGPYYLYFGSECGNWALTGGTPYILIDNFTVGNVKETFNGGVANSIFTVKAEGKVVDSADGEGYNPEYLGSKAAKLIDTQMSSSASTSSFITKNAYAGGTVSFDYYISTSTKVSWWMIGWTTNQKSADMYAGLDAGHTTATNSGQALPNGVVNSWQKATVEIPAGTWYLYIMINKSEWTDGDYVLIDNFAIESADVVETFNYGYADSIFTTLSNYKIELADGRPDPLTGNTMLSFETAIIGGYEYIAMITDQAYSGVKEISFNAIWNGTGNRWGLSYTTNPSAFAYDEGKTLQEQVTWINCYSPRFNALKLDRGVAYAYRITIANGSYAIYVQGGAYSEWTEMTAGTYVEGKNYFYFMVNPGLDMTGSLCIDNFSITYEGGTVVDTFDDSTSSLFVESATKNASHGSSGMSYVLSTVSAPALPETPAEPETPAGPINPHSLAALLESGDVDAFFASKDSWTAANSGALVVGNMPAGRLLLEGYVSYAITGEKEFAIYFGNNTFLFIDGKVLALYVGTECIKSVVAEEVDTSLYFALTSDGKLSARVGESSYVGFGVIAIPTGMKIIGMGGTGKVAINGVNVEKYTVKFYASDVPVYVSDEGIDFTAYAFDSVAMVSEEGFQLLADAGFTKTLALLRGRINGLNNDSPSQSEVERLMRQVEADAYASLELAEKFGMKHYVFNEALYNAETRPNWYNYYDEMFELSTHTLSDAFAGYYFADEPEVKAKRSNLKYSFDTSSGQLVELVKAYQAYRKVFPEGEAWINLNPHYENVTSAYKSNNNDVYKGYVDYYIQNIALDNNGVKGTGFVSVDFYPLRTGGINEMHLWNLEYIATQCAANNLEFRIYIAATESGNQTYGIRATKSKNDLMMQIYSALAYGSKDIIYYQTTDHSEKDGGENIDNYRDAIIDGNTAEPFASYYFAKAVNNEVHTFEQAYMNFDWKSASIFGKKSSNKYTCTPFRNVGSNAGAYGYISSVDYGSADVLIGNFARKSNVKAQYGDNYAYMVVNYGDPNAAASLTATSAVKITFNGTPKRAMVYQQGKLEVVALSSNVLTLNLVIGEGAFVIPIV